MRNIYKTDFTLSDWEAAHLLQNSIIVSPVLESDLEQTKSAVAKAGGNLFGPMQALIFRVVKMSSIATDKLPEVKVGSLVMIQNAAMDPVSSKAKFMCITTEDVYAAWDSEDAFI